MININEELKKEYGYDKKPRLLKEYKEAYLELLGVAKAIMIDRDVFVSANKTLIHNSRSKDENFKAREKDMNEQLQRAGAVGKTGKDAFEFVTKEKVGK